MQLTILIWFFFNCNVPYCATRKLISKLLGNHMFTLSNPIHPGEFLKDAYMEPMDMTVTELAEKLGVSKSSVSRLVTAKSELSYEMAIRLAKVFKRTPEGWMALQTAYGLKQAKQKMECLVS